MSKAGKFFSAILVLIVLIIGAAAVFAATFDINQYRDQIADALSKQTGRAVKFGGPIKLALSLHGIGVAVENASIGNAPWASRPVMASIGKLQLGVGLMPLIDRRVVITELDIRNADILLETNAANEHNWEMKPAAAAEPQASAPVAQPAGRNSPSVGVSVQQLSVTDSQIAMRDKDGKTSMFKVEKMTLAPESRGIAVSLSADYNGTPIKLALKTGAADLMTETKWPYDADVTYGNYHLNAQGNVDPAAKKVDLNPYELAAGGSSLHGQIMASFGGEKPELRGTIMGDKLDPADFKLPVSAADEKATSSAAPASPQAAAEAKPLFSTASLDLGALKSADGSLDIAIGEMTLGKAVLKQVSGKVTLASGDLTVSPVKAMLGQSALQGDIKLNDASPAQYSLVFKAPGVDLATLLQMAGTAAFLSGKGDADIELSGFGNSLHDMAASTSGHIDITAADGTISSAAAGGIASGLAQIFAPGSGNPTLNCAAARFNVSGGIGKDNGILADSSASTVGGSGGFNLGAETVDITLTAKPKTVNTGGITPSVLISGPLGGPSIGLNTADVAQNVASTLLKNNKTAGALAGVLGGGNSGNAGPILALASDVPQGQNACLYSLDHKPAATAAAPPAGNPAVKGVTGQPAGKTKDMGKQLLQGIMGH